MYKVNNAGFPVQIVNMSEHDIYLAPRTHLGVLQPIEPIPVGNSVTIVDINEHEACIEFHPESNNMDEITLKTDVASKSTDGIESLSNIQHLWDQMDIATDISADQETALRQLLEKHRNIFSTSESDIGYCDMVKHKIRTKDDIPVRVPHRRIPPHQWTEVRDYLKKSLDMGIIRPSSSPYAAAAVVVRKSSGKLRLCLDYGLLNAKITRDAYPLPRIDEAIDVLKGAKYFTSLDLAHGYHQVGIEEEDIHKTAFRVGTGGLYEFVRMPMGLCNAPATFMRLMDHAFGDENFQSILVYLDDILVFGSSPQQMLDRLDRVLSKLTHCNLKVKPEKCHIFQKEVRYLGHLISGEGVRPDPEKISTIKNWPVSTTYKDLKSFLGLSSYYRKYVLNFASIARPLHRILDGYAGKRKKRRRSIPTVPFQEKWTDECTTSFETLRKKLISAPILGYPDFLLPFILEIDASHDGLGAILSQDQDGCRVVLAYASRSLHGAECNMDRYSSMKLELLAMKWAISEKFRDLLIGAKFTVYTDNNLLSYFLSTTKLGATETRWAAELAIFNYEIKYRSGSSNRNADALSRKEQSVSDHDVQLEMMSAVVVNDTLSSHLGSAKLPEELQKLIRKTLPDVCMEALQTRSQDTSPAVAINLPEIPLEKLIKAQEEDEYIGKVLKYWKQRKRPTRQQLSRESRPTKKLLKHWGQFKEERGLLYRVCHLDGEDVLQFVLPVSLQNKILESLHDDMGHQGVQKTTSLIQRRCYWPNMFADIEEYCKVCKRCMLSKAGKKFDHPWATLLPVDHWRY